MITDIHFNDNRHTLQPHLSDRCWGGEAEESGMGFVILWEGEGEGMEEHKRTWSVS